MGRITRLTAAVDLSKLPLVAHPDSPAHLAECSECALELNRRREYLETLRSAPVPSGGSDLAARILERTSALEPGTTQSEPLVLHKHFARPLVRAGIVSAATLATAALTVAAYSVGGGTTAPTATSTADKTLTLVSESQSLDATALASLREHGWACPELSSLGYSVVSARSVELPAGPGVVLQLSDGKHWIAVTEEHPEATANNDSHGSERAMAANVGPSLTPNSAPSTEAAIAANVSQAIDSTPGRPWTGVITGSGGRYTITANLTDEQARQALAALLPEDASARSNGERSHNPLTQILRGLRMLIGSTDV
ncbi:hypothetical protein ACQR35_02935 [Pseudarthrobacter sp. J1738]|uniref:hypothetical protein n=1 Tax=unclassified Pseudarthrobacter TaxID=2647000 RepID=UPI003D2D5F35